MSMFVCADSHSYIVYIYIYIILIHSIYIYISVSNIHIYFILVSNIKASVSCQNKFLFSVFYPLYFFVHFLCFFFLFSLFVFCLFVFFLFCFVFYNVVFNWCILFIHFHFSLFLLAITYGKHGCLDFWLEAKISRISIKILRLPREENFDG